MDHSIFFIRSVTTSTSPPSIHQKKLQVNECTETMVEHMQDADPLELQSCLFCKESFLSFPMLAEHVAEVHLSPPIPDCATNDEQVTEQCQSSKKTESRDPPAPRIGFPCSACDFVCRSKGSLQSHFIRKHTNRYEHHCKLCPKKFKIKSDLTCHERSRHKEELVKCDVCGKLCVESASLCLNQKLAPYKFQFACRACQQRMGRREKTCAECDKTLPNLAALKKHLAMHAENRPYNCNVCQMSFALQTDLTAHLLVHTGDRPFDCDICGEQFAQSADLFSHKKLHPDPLPSFPSVVMGDILEQFIEDFKPENLQSKKAYDAEEEVEDGNKEEYEMGEEEMEDQGLVLEEHNYHA